MNTKKYEKKPEVISKIKCINCGTSNQSNFYNSKDSFKGYFKKVVYCKDCVKKIYQYYLKKNNDNMNLALYYTCRKIDVPYIHNNFEGALNTIKNPDSKIKGEEEIISAYFKGLAFSEQNGWGYSFDDSQGENQIEGLASYNDVLKIKKKTNINKEIDENEYDIIEYDKDELIQKFGNFPDEDLIFLETEYMDWENKLNGITDKSTEIMVKEVCLQCNEIRKDRENGVNVEKKLKTLQDLLKTSGLVERQTDVTSDKTVGMLISDIEHKRPVKTVDEDFKDVDNIRDIIIGFTGSLFRAEGKENYYTEQFDEIYKKYSIDMINNIIKKEEKNGSDLNGQ